VQPDTAQDPAQTAPPNPPNPRDCYPPGRRTFGADGRTDRRPPAAGRRARGAGRGTL